MRLRLGFVSVHVTDLAAARRFYGDALGLRVLSEPEPDEVIFDLGGMPLSVHVDRDGTCGRAPGGATGFYLQVDDVDAWERRLAEHGARVTREHERALSVLDADDNEIVLWKPARAWPPPSG